MAEGEPDHEVDRVAQQEEIDRQIPALGLKQRIGGDGIGSRPRVQVAKTEQQRRDQQERQRQQPRGGVERSADDLAPAAAGHVVHGEHRDAAERNAEQEPPDEQIRLERGRAIGVRRGREADRAGRADDPRDAFGAPNGFCAKAHFDPFASSARRSGGTSPMRASCESCSARM